MKETRKLKKRNLQDEESDVKRVGKMQRKKKEKVSSIDPQVTLQANLSEKPKRKKVELKKKKMAEEINSSPVDSKLSKKKRKMKGGNVDISKQSQPRLEATLDEKVKGMKGKMNKTKKKRKVEEISSVSVDDEDEDGHLKSEVDGDNGTEIRNRKSKKSNKKKKMDLTSTKENEKSSDKINEIEGEEDVYQISSGDEDCSKGMKKVDESSVKTAEWVTDYYESRPGLDELQKRIDDFMTAHEERLEQEKQNREAKAAEGGWTVVVHHKGRKKTTEAETGTTVGSVSQAALEDKVAKKKQNEPIAHGFYRFQRREAQRNELLALQSKFEQDKKRIQQLRAARKFKPY